MTDLPKRGDRVRVTEFRADNGRKFPLESFVEVAADATDCGNGFVSFECLTPKGRPTRLDAVRVEIEGRPAPHFRDTTELEKLLDAYHRCDEPSEVLIRRAYQAGLRRAQELADGTTGMGGLIDAKLLKEAIDQELK